MRIISGIAKGRKLATPKNQILRPTSDRVKESIFNILSEQIKGKLVLDLFAGTGNLGIEALSRGAKKAFFVEMGRQALRLIQRNLTRCKLEEQSEIIPKDTNRAIGILYRRRVSFDLILMDPPYESGLIRRTLMKLNSHPIYHKDSILVIEHDRREPLSPNMDRWDLIREKRLGDTVISFLAPQENHYKAASETES
jgi:16S rRNA (guanine(966)-N(2))-methyltransferase RsmD